LPLPFLSTNDCFISNFQNRGSFSNFNDLAEYKYIDSSRRNQTTKFTLTISNWHFVRDHKDVDDCPKLEPGHCMFSFKLHSSTFVTRDTPRPEDEGYQFDRTGCIIPYSAFLSLLSSTAFTNDFVNLVEEKFRNAQLPPTPLPSPLQSSTTSHIPAAAPAAAAAASTKATNSRKRTVAPVIIRDNEIDADDDNNDGDGDVGDNDTDTDYVSNKRFTSTTELGDGFTSSPSHQPSDLIRPSLLALKSTRGGGGQVGGGGGGKKQRRD